MVLLENWVAEDEVEFSAVRAQGAGGQNVNKVSSAVHLRFDINRSSLPQPVKQRLMSLNDNRISKQGIVVIKAQRFRTQEKNRQDALSRLQQLVQSAARVPAKRKPTKVSKSTQRRRVDSKVKRGQLKTLRGKVVD